MTNQATRGSGLLETFLAKRRVKLANSFIPDAARKGKILDIGCGSYPFFLLNTNFKEKIGIDYSLKKDLKYQGIALYNNSIEDKLLFEDNTFDVITMLAVFEHIEPNKLPTLLAEIYRILKPGGIYIMTTPCVWSDKLLRFLASIKMVSAEEINEHKDAYNHERIQEYLINANFNKKDIKLGYFEYFLNNWAIAKK